MKISEIEYKISCHEMNAAQVFTQMKQHVAPQDNWISVSKLNESYVGKKVIFDLGDDIYSGSIGIDDGECYFQDNDFEICTGITMFQVVSLPPAKGED